MCGASSLSSRAGSGTGAANRSSDVGRISVAQSAIPTHSSAECASLFRLRCFGEPLRLAQPERAREPAGDEIADRVLAPDIEMAAIGDDLDIAFPARAVAEAFGRIVFGIFLVAADEQRRTAYLGRQFEHIGDLG